MLKAKKIITLPFLMFFILLLLFIGNYSLKVNAAEITDECRLKLSENGEVLNWSSAGLTDGKYTTYTSFKKENVLNIKSDTPIFSIYVIWNTVPGEWTYEVSGNEYTVGKHGFLHEFVNVFNDVGQGVNEIDIIMPEDISICEIYFFSEGDIPDWVQIWQPPCEKADIMLLSTHSDDEQLFFAGLLPYYAGEVGAAVQVVYLTNHWDTQNRPHEQINGLWTVGVKNYPIVGHFPDDVDTLSKSGESVQETLDRVLAGKYDETGTWNEANLIEFQVEMIRRFKPQVIVAHDINGEYQHGAHIANTDTMMKALAPAADATQYTEIADLYGVWDVPKVYIHLYEENPIEMNWDIPLESFGGKTAFEVSKEGYGCHYSQHWTWFTRWLNNGTKDENASPVSKASEFTMYSPCKFGLYRSLVGNDTKADFLDNIVMYKDQKNENITEDEPLKEDENNNVNSGNLEENGTNSEKNTQKDGFTSLQKIVFYCIITGIIIIILITTTVLINKRMRKR